MRLFGQLSVRIDAENPALRPFIEIVQKGFERVKRSDTEIVIHPIEKGLSNVEHLDYPGFRFFNDREILRSILSAGNEGYDGVVVLCGFDPALRAARQMLDIPVTGIFESSVHVAAMMGRQFAVITREPSYIPETEDNIQKYGMRDQAISHSPVRSILLSNEELMGCIASNHSPLLDAFRKVAIECIKEGAEVLITGCGMLSTLLTHCGLHEVEGVPVIDPMLVGIKVGELMVDLREAGLPFISRKGLYFKAQDLEIQDVLTSCFE